MNYIIENIDIYKPFEIIENGTLVIKGHKIHRIFNAGELPQSYLYDEEYTRIDSFESVLIPGFIDLHIHGGGGADVTDDSETDIAKITKRHLENGTTGLLLTTFSGCGLDDLERQIENIRKSMDFNESILGIHLEGPFLNPSYCGMYPSSSFVLPDVELLKKWIKISNDTIRMITMAPELEGALDLISFCSENSIVTSIGHTDADYELVRKAINFGASSVTHIFNAMSQLHHRDPGVVGAALMEDRLSAQIICDGIHLHPLIVKMIVQLKGAQNTYLVTDAMRAAGMSPGDYNLGKFETVRYENGAVRSKDGTLASTALTMLDSLRNILAFGDVSFMHAVHMTSTTPARLLGLQNYLGAIEEGYDADLIILDRELNLKNVFLKGKKIK